MKFFPFLSILVLLISCETLSPPANITPLEIKTLQTRSYAHDYNVTFRSVVSVFQDLGYIIKSADIDTGFIQAEGVSNSDELLKILVGETQTSQVKVTGFVERVGNHTQVRLNFVNSTETSTAYGARDRQDSPILDAYIYQNAFEKIESAIFLREASE